MPTINGTSGSDLLNGTDGDDAINGLGENDWLDGAGGNDTLDGGDGGDTLIGGAGADTLIGGEGNDTLASTSIFLAQRDFGQESDQLSGGAGDDELLAGYGDNVDGGDGTDYLRLAIGGLATGVTLDTAMFNNGQVFVLGGATIQNVEAVIELQLTDFSDVVTLGAQEEAASVYARGGDDTLTGNDTANQLFGGGGSDTINAGGGNDYLSGGDSTDDGDDSLYGGAGDDGLDGHVGSDILDGGEGNDLLHGGDGVDDLIGAGGDDYLDGGWGSDSLNGGAGSDIYVVDHASDSVAELAGQGTDEVRSGISYTLGSNVENLVLTGPAATIGIGNELDNLIRATVWSVNVSLSGLAGNDTLAGYNGNDLIEGGAGNDVLDGGGGNDTIDGGEGNDTASYASASDWVGVHLSSSTWQDTANAGMDTLISIENLIGSDFSDILSGNDGANRLEGGAGFDVLIGGLGNDLLDGGEGEDEAHYQSAPSAVNVNLALDGAQNTGGAGVDTLISIERVRGSEYNDVLRGDEADNGLVGEGGDDWLFGGAGNDALAGAAGYDRMYGGTGNDIYSVFDSTDFTYEIADEGQDLVLAWVDHQLRDNVEDVILMMNGTAVIGKGNALDNDLTGNDLSNKLYGYDGDDFLGGNGGDDWLFGAGGNDYMHGGAGYDRMYGGTGDDFYAVTDTTDYAYENAGEGTDKVITTINHSLRANIENLQLDGSSDLRGYGNSLNNVIDGNYGNNLLYGREGNDDLRGYDGNDILYGETGNDLLQGGSGQDRFYGGAGADTFLFRTNDFAGMTSGTADRIHDFSQAEGDKINLYETDFNSLVDGFQGHIFIGNAAFSGTAGELRYEQVSGQTYLRADTDGDGDADLAIRIDGLHGLQASDFII